jgi:pyruvate,water dikinase
MGPYTLSFDEVDGTRVPDVGGKGANLGELTRAGFPVPPGFCVTTAAYRDFVRECGELDALLDALDGVTHEDLAKISALGSRLREHLGALAIPAGIRSTILAAWREPCGATRSAAGPPRPDVSMCLPQPRGLRPAGGPGPCWRACGGRTT